MDELINDKLWERAKVMASQRYEVIISEDVLTDGRKIFHAQNPELPGCMAQGASPNEAEESLRDARIDYIYFLLVDGQPVPSPRDQMTQTGIGAGNSSTVTMTHNAQGTDTPSSQLVQTGPANVLELQHDFQFLPGPRTA